MDAEKFRKICNSMPHVDEDVKWENELCFLIAGKMFSVLSLEPEKVVCCFKCSEGKFSELLEREGVIPAPYLARYRWIALENFEVLGDDELSELIDDSYKLIYEKLPRKTRSKLEQEI